MLCVRSSPAISIIIPTLNEGDGINGLIGHIRSLDGGEEAEIIVIDGDQGGSTLKSIADIKTRGFISPCGRGRQMNEGARIARGSLLLFLHADTRLPDGALALIGKAMTGTRFVAGAFDLGIQSDKLLLRLIAYTASIRSRLTHMPFGDQAIFIRKDYFDGIGGFQEIPLMEDMEMMGRIKNRHDEIVMINQKVIASPRRWEREGILFCTIRNWTLQILFLLGISSTRLARFYRQG